MSLLKGTTNTGFDSNNVTTKNQTQRHFPPNPLLPYIAPTTTNWTPKSNVWFKRNVVNAISLALFKNSNLFHSWGWFFYPIIQGQGKHYLSLLGVIQWTEHPTTVWTWITDDDDGWDSLYNHWQLNLQSKGDPKVFLGVWKQQYQKGLTKNLLVLGGFGLSLLQ